MTDLETKEGPMAAKADLGKRFIAAVIDGLLCAGLTAVAHIAGGLVAMAYMLLRDGLNLEFMDRRSIGKKLLKIRPVRLDGRPMEVADSIKRNVIFAVGSVGAIFIYLPLLGWFLAGLFGAAGLILALVELYLVVTDGEGRRLGDRYAGTKVVNAGD